MLESPQVSTLSQLQSGNNFNHFDQATGTLFLFGDEAANTFQQAIAPNGYLELAIDNKLYSSDTQSPFFAPFLIGATDRSIQTITLDGGDGDDKLILGGQLDSPNLSITADDSIDITGSLSATNNLSIHSDKLTLNQATLTATDSNNGGTIHLLGKDISVINSAIAASGKQSGGTILIGGDYQGKGTVPNAKHTYMGSDVQINADATQTGNGGKVIIWADDTTEYFGNITARGGTTSGDGGFVEVSGKQNLKYRGQADLSATNGKFGTLLLDPTNIIISGDQDQGGDTTTINATTLGNQTGNISLVASNSIFVNAPLGFAPSNASLSFTAGTGGFYGLSDIFAPSRNVTISAPYISNVGDIFTGRYNGEYTSALGNVFTGNSIGGNAGSITLNASNDISVVGTISAPSAFDISGYGDGGNLSLSSAFGSITVGGSVVGAGKKGSRIDIIAKGNISIGTGAEGGDIISTFYEVDGQPINLTSTNGSILIQSIYSGGYSGVSSGNNGSINLKAKQDITTGFIVSSSNTANGGNVELISTLGEITTSGVLTDAGATGNGGSIKLKAKGNITDLFKITSNTTGTGNGGNVNITSDQGEITAEHIRTDSVGGNGGRVQLKAGKESIKIKDTFTLNNTDYSIYTDGATGNGKISIERAPGQTGNFFAVGDPKYNGTKGAVSVGLNANDNENILSPTTVVVGSYAKGNIKIFTTGTDPQPVAPNSPSPSVTPTTYNPTSVTEADVAALIEQGMINEAIVALDNQRTDSFFASQNSPRTVPPLQSLSQIQSFLSNGDSQANTSSAMVYTFIRGQNLDFLTVKPSGAPVYKTIPLPQNFYDKVSTFFSDLRDFSNLDYKQSGSPVYNWLIKPIETDIAQVNNLIFSPDSELRDIPVAPLWNGTQHVCERYSSSITPSIQAIKADPYTSLKDADVLKMGATEFKGWDPLPQTLGEMEVIGQLEMKSASPPSKNLIYLNKEFNEQNVRKLVKNGNEQIVHFATHGLNAGPQTQSFIVLGSDDGVRSLNLTASDFRNMKGLDRKELVVLSACLSFYTSPAKEQFGVAGAALIGNAESALGAYWLLADNYELAFMGTFYHQLLNSGMPKNKVLQNMQIAMLTGGVSIDTASGRLLISTPSLGSITLQLPTHAKENIGNPVVPAQYLKHPYAWAALALAGNPW